MKVYKSLKKEIKKERKEYVYILLALLFKRKTYKITQFQSLSFIDFLIVRFISLINGLSKFVEKQ